MSRLCGPQRWETSRYLVHYLSIIPLLLSFFHFPVCPVCFFQNGNLQDSGEKKKMFSSSDLVTCMFIQAA